MRYDIGEHIDRPPETVWDVVTDLARTPQWRTPRLGCDQRAPLTKGTTIRPTLLVMGHDHDHGRDDGRSELDPMDVRVRALETLLTEKGYIDPAALDELIDTYAHRVGPRNGAQVVAQAWVDPEFAEWLRTDATAAIASLGFEGRQGEHMIALEQSDHTHHVVVCTLCSCYPWPVLGLPPTWYKAAPYRSRVVRDPRGVLAEFGVTLGDDVDVRVWDSTAEVRYLVVPQRPAGTADWTEDQLAPLVTRDSMIGVGLALDPDEVAARAPS